MAYGVWPLLAVHDDTNDSRLHCWLACLGRLVMMQTLANWLCYNAGQKLCLAQRPWCPRASSPSALEALPYYPAPFRFGTRVKSPFQSPPMRWRRLFDIRLLPEWSQAAHEGGHPIPIVSLLIEWTDFVWYLVVPIPRGTTCWTGTKLNIYI